MTRTGGQRNTPMQRHVWNADDGGPWPRSSRWAAPQSTYRRRGISASPERLTADWYIYLLREEEDLVYVALTDAGEQITLSPEEFEKKYGWKNDPAKAFIKAEGEVRAFGVR